MTELNESCLSLGIVTHSSLKVTQRQLLLVISALTELRLSVDFLLPSPVCRGAIALLVGHRTCDSQAAGSSPGREPPCSGLGLLTPACLCGQAV